MLVAGLLVVGTVVGVETRAAPSAQALSKIKCSATGYAAVDPIVNHGLVGPSAHGHTYFGNVALLSLPNPNAATYADMVGRGTNCRNSDDSAGYWSPTLVWNAPGVTATTGTPVPIKSFTAYYRAFDGKKIGPASPLPADLRLVAGNPMTSAPQDTHIVNWTCGQFSSVGPTSHIPNCARATGKVVQLTAHVTFPSCWDGVLAPHDVAGDTRDNAHWAYESKGVCPAGFPNRMAELRETISFDYRGNGSNVVLTSDLMARDMGLSVRNGQTLHADFWNTWLMTGGTFGGLTDMVRRCINTHTGPSAECG